MNAVCRTLLLSALAAGGQPGACQSFVYVDPGLAGCPPVPASAAAKTVPQGAAVSGSIRVGCGFEQGSYTVSLNSSDAGARFAPKTFIVNFGRIVGDGAFTVRFSTSGRHSLAATITSNMGSPALTGYFASAVDRFEVVPP